MFSFFRGRKVQKRTGSVRKPIRKRLECEALETRIVMSASDPFSVNAPAFDTSALAPTTFQRGDYSVSDKTGAATYSYPIVVPPGREGMQPVLALSYSSLAPLRGGLAAGWSLALPAVERDTTGGTSCPVSYAATLSGAVDTLVATPDIASRGGTTYRTLHDDTFTIFERYVPAQTGGGQASPVAWLARTQDGVTDYFGSSTSSGDGETRWFLDRQVDRFGNTVTYNWSPVTKGGRTIDYRLDSIEYTSNPQAGLAAHARVAFEYAALDLIPGTSIPVGASSTLRSGRLYYEGASRLLAVVTSVRDTPTAAWRVVRRVSLDYDTQALTGQRAASPMRYLTGIRATAYSDTGAQTVLPPVTFGYGTDAPTWGPGPGQLVPMVPAAPPIQGNMGELKSTLMDIDGDGIPDLVQARVIPAGQPHAGGGELVWYRGLFGGGFSSTPNVIALPTLPWANGVAPTGQEQLTLSGQDTNRRNTTPSFSATPAGPTVNQLSYRFMDLDGDGRVDLIASLYYDKNFYNPLLDGPNGPVPSLTGPPPVVLTQPTAPPTHTGIGSFFNRVLTAPLVTATANVLLTNQPTTSVVPVALNRSDFPSPTFPPEPPPTGPGWPYPPDWEQPPSHDPPPWLPLPPNDWTPTFPDEPPPLVPPPAPSVPAPPPSVQGKWEGFTNGQGYVWWIYRNNGHEFVPMTTLGGGLYVDTNAPQPYLSPFELNEGQIVSRGAPNGITATVNGTYELADINGDGSLDVVPWNVADVRDTEGVGPIQAHQTRVALLDVNGDGLPDLVEGPRYTNDPHALVAYLNNGHGFETTPTVLTRAFTSLEESDVAGGSGWATRTDRYYPVDVDGDGLPDLLDLRGPVPQVYFNLGGEFEPTPHALPQAFAQYAGRNFGETYGDWKQLTDFIDVNGDGLRDLVSWYQLNLSLPGHTLPGGPTWYQITLTQNVNGLAPRRLVSVNDGVGGTIGFHYSPATDPKVVTRDSLDQNNLPFIPWVVDTVTLTDAQGSPASTTAYAYARPVYGSENGLGGGTRRFLGFRAVTEDLPQGGRVVREYTYDLARDARGHLASETTYDRTRAGALVPVTRKELTWASSPEYNGLVTFTNSTHEITQTYAPDGSVPAGNVRQIDYVYQAWGSPRNGQPAMYLLADSVEYSGPSRGDDTRDTVLDHAEWYTANLYLVAVSRQTKREAVPGTRGQQFRTLEDETNRFNAQGQVTRVETLAGPSTFAVTLHDYDPKTGNLLATTKPQQVADGSLRKTTLAYDTFALHVAQTVNELGQQVLTTYDLGTGELLTQRGPNSKLVGTQRVWDTESWRRDGLGRVLEHFVDVDDPKLGYRPVSVEQLEYQDSASPRRERVRQRLDFTQDRWTSTERLYDGWGRLIRETVQTEAGPAVTRYEYDAGGSLQKIIEPRPGETNASATVAYTYERDGLGRVRRLTRPDGSGTTVEYAGLAETVSDVAADGSGGKRTERHDALGRLVQVEEVGGASGTAVSRYEYDGLDRVTRITDADGNVTVIGYDLAGHQSTVTRGTRTWDYRYDLNGNRVAETTPVPAGANPASYTTLYSYDALDRVVRQTPASEGMSASRMKELGIGPIVYSYDGTGSPGDNAVGHLSRVTLPFGDIRYTYNARGLVSREQRSFTVTYLATASATQSVEREYNPLGQPTAVRYDDAAWQTTYDQRGLTASVAWVDPATGASRQVAAYTRSLSGDIVHQGDAYGQTRVFAYDALGRVVRDQVLVGNSALAERQYVYSGSGDLLAVTGQTNGASANATFTYDGLHRLLTARGPNGYQGAFSYSRAGNVLTAQVSWAGSTQARDVSYRYGAVDPQAVDALIDRRTGKAWASFQYDASGAMTRRQTPDGVWTFVYDGNDMLREANGPDGHEAYYYDQNGQRVLAVSASDGVRFWFGERETHFTASGRQEQSYFNIPGAGGTVARVTTQAGQAATVELQYADSLQNLMLSLDTAGRVQAAFLYGAFGEVVYDVGAATHTRRFNGKEDDAATGLRYYGARYYDPLTLRWTSADPKYTFAPDLDRADPRRGNRYTFSGNNPVRYVDPDGLDDSNWFTEFLTNLIPTIDMVPEGPIIPTIGDVPGRPVPLISEVPENPLDPKEIADAVRFIVGMRIAQLSPTTEATAISTEVDAAFESGAVRSGTMIEFSDSGGPLGGGVSGDEGARIWFYDRVNVPGAGPSGEVVQIRTHSPDPAHPAGYTTQITTETRPSLYRLPDGSWKRLTDMSDAEIKAAHMDAGN
jgi:RHS repeat-associated protein